MKEASYYRKLDDKSVLCELCPHHCRIPESKHGICLTRENRDGMLVSANYCRPVSSAIDHIEKKPLFHFYPGTEIYSTGPNGCTFKCNFCQNYEIAQKVLPTREVSAEKIVSMIIESDTIGVAYTYSEPYIWYETIMEVGTLIKDRGLKNVMVTNGYMEPEPVKNLLTVVDAMNIDIKSMNPDFYKRICKGELEPVLRTCEQVKKAGCHLEITNLLITDENNSEEEIHKLTNYIAENLGRDTPLHISRYFPRFEMTNPATPVTELEKAWEIAHEKLDYVYVGNVASGKKEDTFCPKCGSLLIKRSGYEVQIMDTLNLQNENKHSPVCGNCSFQLNIRM